LPLPGLTGSNPASCRVKNTPAPQRVTNRSSNQQVDFMGRIELEKFTDRNITRIYIAKNIKEAQGVEKLLTDNNIE
jgi:hypothetical protein